MGPLLFLATNKVVVRAKLGGASVHFLAFVEMLQAAQCVMHKLRLGIAALGKDGRGGGGITRRARAVRSTAGSQFYFTRMKSKPSLFCDGYCMIQF